MKNLLLEWTEEHRIGIPVLDFEHQNLFAQINELLEDFESHDEKEKIEACLGEIHARMEAHFALEEKFMKDKKYPHFAEHKKAHDTMLDDLVDAITEYENAPEAQPTDKLQMKLKQWIIDHVTTSDKEMSAMAK
jgi:hemerythrin